MLLTLKLPFYTYTSIHNNIAVSTIIYDKWDDFNFDIGNFPFLDGDVPSMVYIQGGQSCGQHIWVHRLKGSALASQVRKIVFIYLYTKNFML